MAWLVSIALGSMATAVVQAAVAITAPSLTITYCTFNSSYQALGNIVITEGAVTDFSLPAASTNYTITIAPPANYQFLAGTGSVSYLNTGDINVAPTITVTASLVTITYQSTRGTRNTRTDAITISGLFLNATNTTAGNLARAGGTGTVTGLAAGAVVGSLATSQNCPSAPPGGSNTNLRLWYEADGLVYDGSGTPCVNNTAVGTWNESSNGFHLTQNVAGQRPVWFDGSGSIYCNYNPSVRFTNNYLANIQGALTSGTTYNKLNLYAVYYDNNASDFDWILHAGGANGLNRVSLSMNWAGAAVFDCDVPATYNRISPNTSTQLPAARTNMLAVKSDNGGIYNGGEANKVQAFCNGTAGPASTGYTSIAMNNSILQVGDNELVTTDGTNSPFTGDLMEIILYTGAVSQALHQRIESYLALKYSVTLSGHDYVNTAGSTVYAVSGAYVNGIIGVARDDGEGLLQKQSRQQDDTTRIFVGTLASTNQGNASTALGDRESVVIGHNGGQMRKNVATNSEKPSGVGIYSRINREWKVTNTAYAGTFSLAFKLNTSPIVATDLRLLVDDDGNFTNATVVGSGLTFTYAGGIVTVGGIGPSVIPTNSTKYITLASVSSTTPLPVEMLYFNAMTEGTGDVDLLWATASENNNDHFELQRSRGGEVFETIGIIGGFGTTTARHDYSFVDPMPYPGVNYYRLKQVDADEGYVYSDVRSVTLEQDRPLHVYPNPSHDVIRIAGLTGSGAVAVFDEAGQQVPFPAEGLMNGIMDVSSLPRGIYIVRIGDQAARIVRD